MAVNHFRAFFSGISYASDYGKPRVGFPNWERVEKLTNDQKLG